MRTFFQLGLLLTFCFVVGCGGRFEGAEVLNEGAEGAEVLEEGAEGAEGAEVLEEGAEGAEVLNEGAEGAEVLNEAYKDAEAVADLLLQIWEDFDTETQQLLQEPLDFFIDDIAMLKYYIDVSEHESLTEKEEEDVLLLILSIEDGIFFFTGILESVF